MSNLKETLEVASRSRVLRIIFCALNIALWISLLITFICFVIGCTGNPGSWVAFAVFTVFSFVIYAIYTACGAFSTYSLFSSLGGANELNGKGFVRINSSLNFNFVDSITKDDFEERKEMRFEENA